MKVAQFLETYYLHDSVVDWLRYDAAEGQLVIQIIFSNWMQDWFEEGGVEQIPGKLIFSGVKNLESNPNLEQFYHSNDNYSGRILDANHISDRDRDGLDAVKIVIEYYYFNYQTRTEDILVMEFLALNVEWLPDAE